MGDTEDVDEATFSATRDVLLKRLRRRWIVRASKFDAYMFDLPGEILERLLGVQNNTICIGQSDSPVWGPATREVTASRVGELSRRYGGSCILSLGGRAGTSFLIGATKPVDDHSEVVLKPSSLRLADGDMCRQIDLVALSTVTSIRVEGIDTDVGQSYVPDMLQNFASLPLLGVVVLKNVRIVAPSSDERRALLGASLRTFPSDLWSGLENLQTVHTLEIQILDLDLRCSAGLCNTIGNMLNLRVLRVMDCSEAGVVRLPYERLGRLESLELLTDDIADIRHMTNLSSLIVTAKSARNPFPDIFVEEVKHLPNLRVLDVRIPESSWARIQGLGDIPGIDRLTLASPQVTHFPHHPVSGPSIACLHKAIVPDSGDGDARVTLPSRSRPRTLALSKKYLKAIRRGVLTSDALLQTLLRSGVRESVKWVGRFEGEGDLVSVENLADYLRRNS